MIPEGYDYVYNVRASRAQTAQFLKGFSADLRKRWPHMRKEAEDLMARHAITVTSKKWYDDIAGHTGTVVIDFFRDIQMVRRWEDEGLHVDSLNEGMLSLYLFIDKLPVWKFTLVAPDNPESHEFSRWAVDRFEHHLARFTDSWDRESG